MEAPRISLITPSYQQAAYLQECIGSVSGDGVEHIVVDGGSNDGSRDILERNADRFTWWCSEKDRGQSDAINKGLAHATGDVFSWLNSDDAWLPGTAERVRKAFAADPELLIFGGQVTHRDSSGERTFDALNDTGDTRRLYADPVINQPATFYRKSVVEELGGVDPALRYVMDVELWLQVLFRHGTQHLRFERTPLAMFRLHDASKTVSQHKGFLAEMAALLHGLCHRTGNTDLANVLTVGHAPRNDLRGIPAKPEEHRSIVRTMTLHFLLKWHGHVHTEQEFRMMRALLDLGLLKDHSLLLSDMHHRATQATAKVAGTTWTRYRIRRKLKHLLR
jgi:glycosyltransferase involved in cell wall biosynthesis